ncbi:MAG TPA: DUF202 domain-containing protein [Vitreimonas sp.]|nr:DUF202 domain-containing protein [Vitreimonas sp.]
MDTRQPPTDPDSRARTHLANERTFLAWLRTGVTLIALGLAAAEFLTHDTDGLPLVRLLATGLIATGILTVVLGVARYREGRARIDRAEFRPASRSVELSASIAAVVGLLAIIFVWLGPR